MWSWLVVGTATAQPVSGGELPTLNAQTFRPSIDGDRLLWADDAARREATGVGRLLLQYVDDPLVYVDTEDQETGLVTSLLQLDVLAGAQVGRVRLGFDLPVYLLTGSDVVNRQSGLGDLALDAKFTALDGDAAPLDVALNARFWAPTSTVDTALGNGDFAWEIAAIASREFGPVLLAANLGTRGGPPTELENIALNDAFIARLGAGLSITPHAGAALEFNGRVPYSAPLTNGAGSPLEALLSGYGYPLREENVVVRGGIGTGLTPGIGSPDYRLILGVGIEPRGETDRDRDGDGILDRDDACPDVAEDFDKFEDTDGCPDLDNDKDGILDVDDGCPDTPEDGDGFEDEDGCPEPTQVRITVIDDETGEPVEIAKVGMVNQATARPSTGLAPHDDDLPPGTYKVQVSAVGYVDSITMLEVTDGDPVDHIVRIKLEPEAPVKKVTREQIELRDTVLFETNRAAIKPESFPLLDEAVEILLDYPEIRELRIEGHTDERGPAAYNLQLSEQRAAAVLEYFVERGVERERLSSQGFGESRPVDPASNNAAWAKNRRVDFFIVVWDDDARSEGSP